MLKNKLFILYHTNNIILINKYASYYTFKKSASTETYLVHTLKTTTYRILIFTTPDFQTDNKKIQTVNITTDIQIYNEGDRKKLMFLIYDVPSCDTPNNNNSVYIRRDHSWSCYK